LIGCPQDDLRKVLQEVVSAAPDPPHSAIGGPWALDSPTNYGSYLFNFGDMSEEKVDDWIRLAKGLGVTQIDFHGGASFRFGDFEPNPKTYPRGRASLKAVIDKLPAAGIQAGLHTYSQFMAKNCPWVTPVPDPRLGKDATFTLAEPLAADAAAVPVVEPTKTPPPPPGDRVPPAVPLAIQAQPDGKRIFRADFEGKIENFEVDPLIGRKDQYLTVVADAAGQNHVLRLALVRQPYRTVPASVTPTWSGWSRFSAKRWYASTVTGTLDDFIDTQTLWKPMLSSRSTSSRALSTSALAVGPPCRSKSSFFREPALTPTRMGIPRSAAARATSRTRSFEPMFPGLMRSLSMPASTAISASL
jgi:hypothetical protein